MSDKPMGFVVCRRASDPLKPGFVREGECAICKKKLQLSPTAREGRATGHLLTLCNPCGFAMAERLHKAGQLLEVAYTTEFLESFDSYVKGHGVP
jgi:hypothetical protein